MTDPLPEILLLVQVCWERSAPVRARWALIVQVLIMLLMVLGLLYVAAHPGPAK